jgi:large subunit ribosomal protein L10
MGRFLIFTSNIMAINKAQKKQIIDDLSAHLKKAQAVAFVNFNMLSVNDTTDLRKSLHAEGVSYQVAKKTLIKRALGEGSVTGTLPTLDGNIAIAWSLTDAIAPARLVYGFRKGKEDKINLVGGVFEGRYMDATAINEIATIPSMQVLRGMFVNVINSPIQGFVSALNQIAEKKA